MLTSPDSFLDSELDTSNEAATLHGINQATRTTKKDYRAAYIYINITSYSQRSVLHNCARAFQISKIPAVSSSAAQLTNIDFVFGHSVGAGIQTYLVTRNKAAALFASLLAWNTDLDAALPKKGKSAPMAFLAVEKFSHWWEEHMAGEWELAYFNNKPATEVTFLLDLENGYYHAGHIDVVLRNRVSGKYLVLEIKTTAIKNVDEAQYGNSEQPLGYSLVLDAIAENLDATNSFEVLYLVYSSTERKLIPFTFKKQRTERAEWLQDLLLDHSLISTYRKLSLFPKRGNSCWSFGGRCPHYGTCDLGAFKDNFDFREYKRSSMELPERTDFEFTLGDITRSILMDKVAK